jgi:hypothetical protein
LWMSFFGTLDSNCIRLKSNSIKGANVPEMKLCAHGLCPRSCIESLKEIIIQLSRNDISLSICI